MTQKVLTQCGLYKLLQNRRTSSSAQSFAGKLVLAEANIAGVLEYIKTNFSNFTEHGIQHSLRIIEYIEKILTDDAKEKMSNVEIFCFIMSAFLHDVGMTKTNVDDKEKQRMNHHLYVREFIEVYFDDNMKDIEEYRRLRDCIIFVCEAHGRDIKELYEDSKFGKEDSIQGESLRYGLLAVLLRIGDLMDMEEGRTSEFNMHINFAYYQDSTSIEHHSRHLEISSYSYDYEKIDINIVTSNRNRFRIWEGWLQYLDEEIMYANTHYMSLRNSRNLGNYKFPEVKKSIKPNSNANFLTEEIRFQLDDNGALWDILTKSIYTNEFDYIRELIQNAIDATLLRYYADKNKLLEHASPRTWNVVEKVSVLYNQTTGTLIVSDCGTGMDENEIRRYLFKAADSGYKYKTKRESFDFPAIAKFGIGFIACLTKAEKIEIVSQAANSELIRAEIEEKSILAFVEKDEKTDDLGTLIKIEVKNKFSFKELETYIMETFVYPSVTIELIDLVSLHKLDSKLSYLNIDTEKIALGEWRNIISNQIDTILAKREFCLSPYVQDKKLIGSIVLFSEGGRKKKELKTLLAGVTHKSIVKEKLKEIINDEKVTTNDIHNIIIHLSDDLDKKMREYPDFWKEIKNRSIANITNYEMLNIVLDENFDIVQIITDNIEDISKGRGILFIRSEVILPDLGIEWQSVNSFLYNSGKIVRNMLKLSRDDTTNIYDEEIISLREIEDADYEMDNLYEDEENENYYEQVSRGNRETDIYDSEWTYVYDLLVAKKNNYIIGYGIESDRIISFIEENEETGWYDFLENSRFLHEYKGENITICSSEMYQDGIKIDIEPQMLLPLGVGWSIVNLTSRARFDLNVSRHEISNNREVIDEWMDTYGKIVQRIIVERCTGILKKMNLQYSMEDILADRKTGEYLEKKSFQCIRDILKEV